MATSSFTQWEFQNFHVQQDLKGGQFISAESTLVGAGPPNLTAGSSAAITAQEDAVEIFPIGVLESVAIQQNKQLQRIFEIGSSRSYFIPGRTIGSVSIGRTFYYGPSLLRALYAYYNQAANGNFNDISKTTAGDPYGSLLSATVAPVQNAPKRTPGFGFFLIDLASDLFALPMGLCVYFKDYQSNTMGAFYINESYVQGHQMTISSGSVLVMEGASIQFDSISPIKTVGTATAL